jgi:DNA segregation ATPase FtsK/SpoIIIE-like protein
MAFKAMSEIQSKPDWKQKVYNDEIVAKWKVSIPFVAGCGMQPE